MRSFHLKMVSDPRADDADNNDRRFPNMCLCLLSDAQAHVIT